MLRHLYASIDADGYGCVKSMDEAIAWNLHSHVMCQSHSHTRKCIVIDGFAVGYEFLMQNCMFPVYVWNIDSLTQWVVDSEGDRICILGFSRGAYTARR